MIKIYEKYGPNANPPNTDYPVSGSVKNKTTPGATDGTPIDEAWLNDMIGGDLALLNAGGVTPSGDTDTALVSDRMTALMNLLIKAAEPVGQVNFFYANTVPDNYLIMDGSHWSKTTYSELFAKIGSLPNVSSDTLEFWIESSESRFTRATSLNNQVGTVQEDAIRNITGVWENADPTVTMGFYANMVLSGAFKFGGNQGSTRLLDHGNNNYSSYPNIEFDASLVVPTANENRPKDYALLQCIKYTLGF